jgi:hypothetical protein
MVLLLDAGLATAGALLLKAGLGAKKAAPEATASGSAASGTGSGPAASASGSATAAARGSAAAAGSAAGSVLGSAPAGSGSAVVRAGSGARAGSGSQTASGYVSDLFGKTPDAALAVPAPPDATIAVSAPPPDAAPPPPPPDAATGPVDPYGGSGAGSDVTPPPDAALAPEDPHTEDLAAEVDKKSDASQSHFRRCYEDAAKAYTPDQPLVGEVDIAFRVMPTGEVQNAAAVKNTTGSDKLADCLAAVIGAWSFPPSDLTEPAAFIRPMSFDGH